MDAQYPSIFPLLFVTSPPWICKHVPVHLMLDACSARANKETGEAQAIPANEKASQGPEANERPRG